MNRLCLCFVIGALTLSFSPSLIAQEEQLATGLSRILQGLEWGSSHDDVLSLYREIYLNDYRAEIAGLRDPLEIDEIRRRHEQRFETVEGSYETFDATRTGYEVSVIGGEVVAGANESMLTVRTDSAMLYYIFSADELFKISVAYNSTYLGGLEFESFLEQVERRYGPPMSTEVDETTAGARFLARALWEEESTRLRVENRSNVFGTFVMVFSSPSLEDRVVTQRGAGREGTGAVEVSDLVRQLSTRSGSSGQTDAADQIIGSPTTVELTVPEEAPVQYATPDEAAPMADAESEMSESEESETEESDEEESGSSSRTRRDREEEPEEEGITIY